MGCKRITKRVLKGVAQVITPTVMKTISTVVTDVESAAAADPMFFSDNAKRTTAFIASKAALKAGGHEVRDNLVHLAISGAIEALKKAGAKLEEVGEDDPDVLLDSDPA